MTGVLEHESGALSTLTDELRRRRHPARPSRCTATGSLVVPDPNNFDGDVQLHELGGEWRTLESSAGYRDAGRGYGMPIFSHAGQGRPRGPTATWPYHCSTS